MENRPAPHAHLTARNIERLSPGTQDATVTEINGVPQLQNSGPFHCGDVDPTPDYENVLTD